MTSPFQDAAAAASAAVDDFYGEPFQFAPMASIPNGRPSADPGRAVVTFTAAFIDVYARFDSKLTHTFGVVPEKPGHSSSRPQISFDPASLPYRARNGDRVIRTATGDQYQLAEVRSDQTRRMLCDLNLIKSAARAALAEADPVPLIWPTKDPDEVLDYQIDWSARLNSDTISTSVWTVPDGITGATQSNTTTSTTLWLSGGTDGSSYDILNRITTAGGRTMDQTVRIAIAEK